MNTKTAVALPKLLLDFIDDMNAGNSAALAGRFNADGLIRDENQEHHGREAIRGWLDDVTEKYHSHTEVLSSREVDGETVLTCRVQGTFPGSPIELDYRFAFANGGISSLTIE